jgi:hypothetical protein
MLSSEDIKVDYEAQMDVEERQVDDTAEKQKLRSSSMSTHCLNEPSPHLSSS